MKLCRYDEGRVGLVEDGQVFDASPALDALPPLRWPVPIGDQLVAAMPALSEALAAAAAAAEPTPVERVRLLSPVANPSKIIGAPVNYGRHLDEARQTEQIHHGQSILPIEAVGLFLKATSSLVGAGEGIALRFDERRNDHEVELAVVIGRRADRLARADAAAYIAGYAIGLDITVRGREERSLRKSVDSYSVLGPWLVTSEEIPDPGKLDLRLSVNGELRQHSNTGCLLFDVPRLIEYASSFYTLHPGDVIMSGTPEGVGPLQAGDVLTAEIEGVGAMSVPVRDAEPPSS